jgi:hypothetical protein
VYGKLVEGIDSDPTKSRLKPGPTLGPTYDDPDGRRVQTHFKGLVFRKVVERVEPDLMRT